jgi:hypothetical protein
MRNKVRVRYLREKFGLTLENVRKIEVAAVQAVALYGSDLWRDKCATKCRMTELQLVNRQAQSITGMLSSTSVGPLVEDVGFRQADSLLSSRHRRYETLAFGLPIGHPIGDGIRRATSEKHIFGKLSKAGRRELN